MIVDQGMAEADMGLVAEEPVLVVVAMDLHTITSIGSTHIRGMFLLGHHKLGGPI
jgi:hypothetical protein